MESDIEARIKARLEQLRGQQQLLGQMLAGINGAIGELEAALDPSKLQPLPVQQMPAAAPQSPEAG